MIGREIDELVVITESERARGMKGLVESMAEELDSSSTTQNLAIARVERNRHY